MTFWESREKDKARIAELEREKDDLRKVMNGWYGAFCEENEKLVLAQTVVDAARDMDGWYTTRTHKALRQALRNLDEEPLREIARDIKELDQNAEVRRRALEEVRRDLDEGEGKPPDKTFTGTIPLEKMDVTRHYEDHSKPQPSVFHWSCECGWLHQNAHRGMKCTHCDRVRPDEKPKPSGEWSDDGMTYKDHPKPQLPENKPLNPTTWTCPLCEQINIGERDYCLTPQCGLPKPQLMGRFTGDSQRDFMTWCEKDCDIRTKYNELSQKPKPQPDEPWWPYHQVETRGIDSRVSLTADDWDRFQYEHRELLADKARLDWLEENRGRLLGLYGDHEIMLMAEADMESEIVGTFDTFRAAIDAARETDDDS